MRKPLSFSSNNSETQDQRHACMKCQLIRIISIKVAENGDVSHQVYNRHRHEGDLQVKRVHCRAQSAFFRCCIRLPSENNVSVSIHPKRRSSSSQFLHEQA